MTRGKTRVELIIRSFRIHLYERKWVCVTKGLLTNEMEGPYGILTNNNNALKRSKRKVYTGAS
jgi:hypothetical protein